jgi:multicomponent Na+:H+ antiporter subunit E
MKPGVIRLPLSVTTDGEILLLSAMINITPGSVALDVSADRESMYVHVMHIRTLEDAKLEIKNGFERKILALRGEKERLSDAA